MSDIPGQRCDISIDQILYCNSKTTAYFLRRTDYEPYGYKGVDRGEEVS